jgi:hypothetical protein
MRGGAWHVPLNYFANDLFLRSAHLICENDNDFDVYIAFGRAAIRALFPGCTISAESRAGGGGGTAGVLQRLLADPNPIGLCILDSDKEHIGGAEGATAKGCRHVFTEGWRVDLVVLKARELENLIPLHLVSRFFNDGDVDDLLREFSKISPDLSNYVCLKSGEGLCRFHSLKATDSLYARTKSALLESSAKSNALKLCAHSCGDVGCKVTPIYGERFLANLGGWLEQNMRSIDIQYNDWRNELREVVNQVIERCISLPRKV